MTVVWRVTKPCGHVILRTTDKETAVEMAKVGDILDAIPCRSPEAEARELGGVVGCGCGA